MVIALALVQQPAAAAAVAAVGAAAAEIWCGAGQTVGSSGVADGCLVEQCPATEGIALDALVGCPRWYGGLLPGISSGSTAATAALQLTDSMYAWIAAAHIHGMRWRQSLTDTARYLRHFSCRIAMQQQCGTQVQVIPGIPGVAAEVVLSLVTVPCSPSFV